MATYENDTLIRTKDESGNDYIHYPITTSDNVLVPNDIATKLAIAAQDDSSVSIAISKLIELLAYKADKLFTDITHQAVNIDNLLCGSCESITYLNRFDAGAANITGLPADFAGKSFMLRCENVYYAASGSKITRQTICSCWVAYTLHRCVTLAADGTVTATEWSNPADGCNAATLEGKGAAAFALSSHVHSMNSVTGLESALNGKAASSHTHKTSDVSGLDTALAGKAESVHSHSQSQITGLSSALAGKAESTHTHGMTDVTGLDSALKGKAASSHTHQASEISGLPSKLPADGGNADTLGGKSVDMFALAAETVMMNWSRCPQIPAYANLDEYIEPGTYLILTSGILEDLKNPPPSSTGGWFRVYRRNDTLLYQEFKSWTNSVSVYRSLNGTSWTGWKATDTVPTATNIASALGYTPGRLASGTAAADADINCPSGSWYGQHNGQPI